MEKDIAEGKADHLISLVLTHQTQLFQPMAMSANRAQDFAQALATMRKTLIEELLKQ